MQPKTEEEMRQMGYFGLCGYLSNLQSTLTAMKTIIEYTKALEDEIKRVENMMERLS